MNETDETHLRRAIALAQLARDSGEQPFGSLLLGPDGTVLREDHNTVLSERDVTAHPELKLARWAARELDADTVRATTLYTSCQPCGMCAGVIARAGLGRVVFALSSEQLAALRPPGAVAPDVGVAAYDGPGLYDEARIPVSGYPS
jgi:tRNA(Arg) A34 adenosine deaminase TadA